MKMIFRWRCATEFTLFHPECPPHTHTLQGVSSLISTEIRNQHQSHQEPLLWQLLEISREKDVYYAVTLEKHTTVLMMILVSDYLLWKLAYFTGAVFVGLSCMEDWEVSTLQIPCGVFTRRSPPMVL